MKTPSTTPKTIPPAAAILIEWLPNAEGPTAVIIGIIPTINAKEVMIIGRRRSFAASIADAIIDLPALLL